MASIPLQPVSDEAAPEQGVLIRADNLGIRYSLSKRDDLQSMTYKTLLRRSRKKEFWALRNVSLQASAGDVIGIVGPNGAGKTTFCRVLAGLLRPDEGSLELHGKISALLSLGTGFKPDLSGRENAILNGLMLGVSKKEIQSLLPEIIDFSGLGPFIDQPLKFYSQGMKSRLGFSIASALRPSILVIDETLTSGDLEFSERAGKRLRELVQRARLAVVVTHQLSFVEKYCNRCIWLDRGELRASGTPEEVVGEYRTSLPVRRPARIVEFAPTESTAQPVPVIKAREVGVRFRLRKVPLSIRRSPGAVAPGGEANQLWALKEIDLTVNEGEILGVIGPNGAGKTTLCRVMTGILKPDRGSISVEGSITALLTLGAGFNSQLSGRDNIVLSGLMLGIARRRLIELRPEIIEFSGVEKFIDIPVKYYSSGMRSRLAFSILSAVQPDVFIIDEALRAGDAAFYEKAARKIQELIKKARAVVVVTHSMAFVKAVCTRAVWIKEGRIAFAGDPEEVIELYRKDSSGR